jgi:hypothetical protein
LQTLTRRRLDAGSDSQLRDVLYLGRNLADQFFAAAHQHQPLVRQLDDEFHLPVIDPSPAVLNARRNGQGLWRCWLARRSAAARHHLGPDADAETADTQDVSIDLADQLLPAPQRYQRHWLDLDDVFQLPIIGGLPSVIHPKHSCRHQYRDSVHPQYSFTDRIASKC